MLTNRPTRNAAVRRDLELQLIDMEEELQAAWKAWYDYWFGGENACDCDWYTFFVLHFRKGWPKNRCHCTCTQCKKFNCYKPSPAPKKSCPRCAHLG